MTARRRRGAAAARAWPGEPTTASRRHQVTDIGPPPEPKVTQYMAQAKECPYCRTVTEGELPAHVRARASYGPEACAYGANLTCGHYIPVHRATVLLCQLAGITASTRWMAGIRARAAALIGDSGFMDRVRELLRAAPAIHADETPARVIGAGIQIQWLEPGSAHDRGRGFMGPPGMPIAGFLVGTRRTVAAPAAHAAGEIIEVRCHDRAAGYAPAPPQRRRPARIGLQRLKPGFVNHSHSRLVSPSRELPCRSIGHDRGLHHKGPTFVSTKARP